MSLEQPVVVQFSSASSSHFCQMAERNESTPAEYFRRATLLLNELSMTRHLPDLPVTLKAHLWEQEH